MIKAIQGVPGHGMTYQTPRQSSAYLLALSRLDELIAQQRLTMGDAGRGPACGEGSRGAGAKPSIHPVGNHGVNVSEGTNHD